MYNTIGLINYKYRSKRYPSIKIESLEFTSTSNINFVSRGNYKYRHCTHYDVSNRFCRSHSVCGSISKRICISYSSKR
jgi:hypothetical protein